MKKTSDSTFNPRFFLRNIGVGHVDIENLGPIVDLHVETLKTRLLYFEFYVAKYEDPLKLLLPTNVK